MITQNLLYILEFASVKNLYSCYRSTFLNVEIIPCDEAVQKAGRSTIYKLHYEHPAGARDTAASNEQPFLYLQEPLSPFSKYNDNSRACVLFKEAPDNSMGIRPELFITLNLFFLKLNIPLHKRIEQRMSFVY